MVSLHLMVQLKHYYRQLKIMFMMILTQQKANKFVQVLITYFLKLFGGTQHRVLLTTIGMLFIIMVSLIHKVV